MSVKLESGVGLREYFERIIDERERLADTRFEAVYAAQTAAEKQVAIAFAASEKAIVKAEEAQREYNIRSNEFRGQLDDQAKTLMPRAETDARFNSLEDKFALIQKSMDIKVEEVKKDVISLRESRSESGGKAQGLSGGWAAAVGILGLVSLVIAIASRFF